MKTAPRVMLATAVAVPVLAGVAATPVLQASASQASVQTPLATANVSAATSDVTAADLIASPQQWSEAATTADQARSIADPAGAIRTYGTTRTPAEAVARLQKWADHKVTGYYQQCLRLTDDAYGAKGRRTGTALMQWKRARKAGLGHVKDPAPPVGAQMFWDTKNVAGHVATYVGDGKVVSNVQGGLVKVVSWKKMDEWGKYLGWAEPYYPGGQTGPA